MVTILNPLNTVRKINCGYLRVTKNFTSELPPLDYADPSGRFLAFAIDGVDE